MVAVWLSLFIYSVVVNTQVSGERNVSITILENAVAQGAVCLDGSPPAYNYFEGFGNGISNWIVYIQGGGWCTSKDDCLDRSKGKLWSSHMMDNQTFFSGLLDDDCAFNPDFCNWHKVYINYCDGSSFMSDVKQVDPQTNLTFRGARIFNAMMDEMLAKGMRNAQNTILTGTSAGGLATILHCDVFRALLPNTSKVECISNSGFFIHGNGLPGVEIREKRFAEVVATHELANSLPMPCTSKMNPSLCVFPEYLVGYIQTPLFLIESAFDSYQVQQNLMPAVGGIGEWNACISNFTLCNATQLEILRDFRSVFIETLMKLDNSSSRGMYVHSCYRHGHIFGRDGWTCSSVAGNTLANKTIRQVVADWYVDRNSFFEIDITNNSPRKCASTLSKQCFDQKCLATLHHNRSEFYS